MFPFRLSLNASTLFPFKLSIPEQVRVAAEAGYEGVEIWVRDVEAYLTSGGTIAELRRSINGEGIQLVNAIAFWKWSDEEKALRVKSLEQAKRELNWLAELGCDAVAAPPYGNVENVSLDVMALNFAELAQISRGVGIEALLEFWGRAKRLSRLSEVLYVAMESGVPNVKVLLDPFHMYTGGSSVESLSYLSADRIGIVHVNDCPATPPREEIADRDRVFPGEGILPSKRMARLLQSLCYTGYLSLELFVEDYRDWSALEVANRGIKAIMEAYAT